MEIFYADRIEGGMAFLDADESAHCVRVLRHRAGDSLSIVDGRGNLLKCALAEADSRNAVAEVLETVSGWGAHPYSLTMAVCPTKHNDRFEWFVEKAVELGVDVIAPVIGERSERRIFKKERSERIALSAMKQSLKAKLPEIQDAVTVKDFILSRSEDDGLKMICHCFEGEESRRSIQDVLLASESRSCTVLIGPEGDFSEEEACLAVANGFVPVHLGPSRLRTETAAVAAVTACYLHFAGNLVYTDSQ